MTLVGASGVEEWALVVTAGLTALAACAAWAAVWQSRNAERQRLLPSLQLGGLAHDRATHELTLIITNLGAGAAKHVQVVYVQGIEKFQGVVHDDKGNHLRPGEAFRLTATLQGVGALPEMIFLCRDVEERDHVWSRDARHKVHKRSKRFGLHWYNRETQRRGIRKPT